jgi:hypothetical protein
LLAPNNLLNKKKDNKLLKMIFGEHIYFEGVDITKNCTKLDFYHTSFDPS